MSEWFDDYVPRTRSQSAPGFPFLIHLLRSLGVTMIGLLVRKAMVAVMGYLIHCIGRQLREATLRHERLDTVRACHNLSISVRLHRVGLRLDQGIDTQAAPLESYVRDGLRAEGDSSRATRDTDP